MKTSPALLATICVFALVAPAAAQTPVRPPATGGTTQLTGDFAGDPRQIPISANGSRDASTLGRGCTGLIGNVADVRIDFTRNGNLPLIFSVASSADVTLVIQNPQGQWVCDDDSGQNGGNPAIRFTTAGSGEYDVYIGRKTGGAAVSATLYISELTYQ